MFASNEKSARQLASRCASTDRLTTWRLRGLLPTATGVSNGSKTNDQEPELTAAGAAGGASPSPWAPTSTSVTIDPADAQIVDEIDRRTPASASWYNECCAAAMKRLKSSDLDEEGD